MAKSSSRYGKQQHASALIPAPACNSAASGMPFSCAHLTNHPRLSQPASLPHSCNIALEMPVDRREQLPTRGRAKQRPGRRRVLHSSMLAQAIAVAVAMAVAYAADISFIAPHSTCSDGQRREKKNHVRLWPRSRSRTHRAASLCPHGVLLCG